MNRDKIVKRICRFKGKDHSLGFRTGKAYMLTLEEIRNYKKDRLDRLSPSVHISCVGGSYCVYSSWDKFLENWEIVG